MQQKPKYKIGDEVWFLAQESGRFLTRCSKIRGVLERLDGYYYDTHYEPDRFASERKFYATEKDLQEHMIFSRIAQLEEMIFNCRGTLKYYQEHTDQKAAELRRLEDELKMLTPGKLPDPNANAKE